MLKSYLLAAIRNLLRDRAYAAINICALALGFATAILIALFVRDELSYDRAYPDSERIFRVSMDITGGTPTSLALADALVARALELDFPEVEMTARLRGAYGTLRQHEVEVTSPSLIRAEANFFRLFPPRVVAGDAVAALERPDMLVVTRRFARQLFGRENVLGEAVELNRQRTLHVGAVIENLPSNTHFNFDAVRSTNENEFQRDGNAYTYLRLRPGAEARKLRERLPDFAKRHFTGSINGEPGWKRLEMKLVALPELHFLSPSVADMKAPSDRRTVQALSIVGLLILLVAASNFVSMMTARAARRAIEVGVRKAVGATRRQIIVQFLGECLFYVGLALGLAMFAVELVLPGFDAFLQRDIAFDYLHDPALGGAVVVAWLAVSFAAGTYAAFVLSLFRPVSVLKGVLPLPGGPGRLRQAMVVLQFGTLVVLIVATLTIHRQTQFAMEDQLRVSGDQLYLLEIPCVSDFRDIARRIAGVREATCASGSGLGMDRGGSEFVLKNGGTANLNPGHVDAAFFSMFAIRPLAGRLFDPQHGEDNLLVSAPASAENPSIVLNESAARVLGYAHPADAVGATRYWHRVTAQSGTYTLLDAQPSKVIGVVPDFTAGSIRDAIQPTAYFIDPVMSSTLVLKLDGKAVPETLRALEVAWKRAATGAPFGGRFMSQVMNDLYADILRQSKLFAGFSCVAIVVAAMGLLGLAVFTAQRRTREIGLRKVMGASRADILRFIAWQFARPVLMANLIAWPVAWFFMRRWLEGFAYHVDLGPLVFLAASGLALGLALVTVSGHALLVASAKPVEALRYE